MAPHKFYGMITMNHCYDDLIGEVATTTVCTDPAHDATTYIRPLAEARRKEILDGISTLRGMQVDYGVAVIELGTGDDSTNWHTHIAFYGKWNYQT